MSSLRLAEYKEKLTQCESSGAGDETKIGLCRKPTATSSSIPFRDLLLKSKESFLATIIPLLQFPFTVLHSSASLALKGFIIKGAHKYGYGCLGGKQRTREDCLVSAVQRSTLCTKRNEIVDLSTSPVSAQNFCWPELSPTFLFSEKMRK